MSIMEWWWLFDAKYVENQMLAKGFYVSKEDKDDLRKRHKERMEAMQ